MERVRLRHVPALDGLRGVAVVAVVLYHAGLKIPGGFLGVDVFFVISGYLITSLLLAEWSARHSADLAAFWRRRLRRILPAVTTLIVATLAFALIFLPADVPRLRVDALAAFTYSSNWYLVFGHQPYFEVAGRPSLFQHLWSLAIEEQFYLLWPPMFVGLMLIARPRWACVVVVGCAVASAALMALLYSAADTSRIYYGTDTRAAELLIGAALAFAWRLDDLPAWTGRHPILLDALGVAALGVLVCAVVTVDGRAMFIYRGGFDLFAAATAVLIASAVRPASLLARASLGREPWPWIGLRSYGIYLWHWPIVLVTRPHLDVPFDGVPLLCLRLGLTLLIAEASYRCVEKPLRSGTVARGRCLVRHSPTPQLVPRVSFKSVTSGAGLLLASTIVVVAFRRQITPPPYLSVTSIDTVSAVTSRPVIAPVSLPDGLDWVLRRMDASSRPRAEPQPPSSAPSSTSDARDGRVLASDPFPAEPSGRAVHGPAPSTPRVTAIGDSVMVGAAPALEQALAAVQIDASVGRQVSSAIDVVRAMRNADELGQVVVIDMGNNGTFANSQFDSLMQLLTGVPRVVFVNVTVPREWEETNNDVILRGVDRYPNAVLVNWHAASIGHPEFLYSDGIHLRPEGAHAYAQLIAASVVAP